MPRNGSGVYGLPAAYLATTGTTITATQHNVPLTDIEADLNAARPVGAGGTGASTAAVARDNLGLTIGSDVQAFSTKLTAIAALTPTDGNFIVGNGTTWVVESGATARASLGLTIGTDIPDIGTAISAGTGLTGGGDLTTDRTISADFASQSEAQTGSSAAKIMSPARVKDVTIGAGQTWQNVTLSRSAGTGYQNATGKPIMVCIQFNAGIADPIQVSTNGSSWVTIFNGSSADAALPYSFIVPAGHYYRINGTVASLESWAELR